MISNMHDYLNEGYCPLVNGDYLVKYMIGDGNGNPEYCYCIFTWKNGKWESVCENEIVVSWTELVEIE